MRNPVDHIFGMTPDALRAWCAAPPRGWPAFRAQQIMDWVYAKGVADPALMLNLKPAEREALARDMTFLSGEVAAHEQASDGTQKLLVRWETKRSSEEALQTSREDAAQERAIERGTPVISLPLSPARPGAGAGAALREKTFETECVMIPADYDQDVERADGGVGDFARKTACISSQVGCPVGCKFCASGIGGLDGNLSAGRIVEQVWRLGRLPGVGRITNVVFMGMGEPLSNFGAVTSAIRTLAAPAPWGMGISARKITISTVGLPQAIERLAEELQLPVTLALSLHAPSDEIRRTLIPWAQYTTIDALLAACDKWFQKTRREITLEYTLLGGVNDLPEHAHELARLAKRLRANVNIIRYNEVRGMPFSRPKTLDVRRFQEILREARVNAHIRASRGRDIAAACGQLRHERGGERGGD